MCDEYLRKLEKEVMPYYKSFYEYDYENIIKICMEYYNEFMKHKPSHSDIANFKIAILNYIISLSFRLDKIQIKNYITILKRLNMNRIKSKYCPKFLIKPYIYLRMMMLGEYNFVKKKSTKLKLKSCFTRYCSLSKKIKSVVFNYLVLDYVELVITTKCTLKCKSCANLMYKYKKPYDVDLDVIKKSIRQLYSCCNYITTFRILGGEPFCNPNLKYILKELDTKKIKDIRIVTNGTIIPKDSELIKCIKEKNIIIEISDYGNLSRNKDKLIDFCRKNSIICYHSTIVRLWMDYGDLKKYRNNIKKQFKCCDINCKSILNGKLYYCPRLAHGIDLGVIKAKPDEYIDLLNNPSKKELKDYIFRDNPISACAYCKYATNKSNVVPVAEQLKVKHD